MYMEFKETNGARWKEKQMRAVFSFCCSHSQLFRHTSTVYSTYTCRHALFKNIQYV